MPARASSPDAISRCGDPASVCGLDPGWMLAALWQIFFIFLHLSGLRVFA
jgi:hypothetical protein